MTPHMRSRSRKVNRSNPNVHPSSQVHTLALALALAARTRRQSPSQTARLSPKTLVMYTRPHLHPDTGEALSAFVHQLPSTFPSRGLGPELSSCSCLSQLGAELSCIDRVATSVAGRAGSSCSGSSDPSVSGRGMGYIVSRLQSLWKEGPGPDPDVSSRHGRQCGLALGCMTSSSGGRKSQRAHFERSNCTRG